MARIVEFSNGKFGIQTRRFPRTFLDLKETGFTWGIGSKHIEDCQETFEVCKRIMNIRFPKVIRYV